MNNWMKSLFQDRLWLVVLVILAVLVILLRLPSLEQPFDNDSGANAYHARLIVRGEPLYGTHHPTHHLPGVYYTYALAFLIFGDSLWAIKFFLLLWTLATAFLIYRLGKLVTDSELVGFLAALFYVILSAHVQLAGTSAETELFANLPRVAAILILIYLVKKERSGWQFVWVGFFAAVAFLYKAVYLTPLVIAGYLLLLDWWRRRKEPGLFQTTLKRSLWIGAGFGAGFLLVAFYFWSLGLLPRFFQVFTHGQEYVNFRIAVSANYPPQYRDYWLLFPVYGLAQNNVVLLGYSGLGMVTLFLYKPWRTAETTSLVVWYLVSIVQASITRVLFYHYFILIIPPLAILAAIFITGLTLLLKNKMPFAPKIAAALALVILLVVPLAVSVDKNYDYYYHFVRYKLGQQTFEEFLLQGWPEEGRRLVQVQTVADYIKEQTSPEDRIYYWSGNMQLYYLADRRCSVDIIWPIHVNSVMERERIYGPTTKYIILGRSNNLREYPDWLTQNVEQLYVEETEIDGQKIFRRRE